MPTEIEIIDGLRAGRDTAVERVVSLYGNRLLRIALAITGDLYTAEEVVQDTFLQACRKIHTFREHSSLETWLFQIAMNLAKNRLRSSWFRRVTRWEPEYTDRLPTGPGDEPETRLILKENSKEIIHSLQVLPIKYRTVLVFYYLEELSIAEISLVLKQPEGTVKSNLFRGRARLKEVLKGKKVNF